MGFGIDLRAVSRRARGGLRALLGKAPDAAEVGARLARLAPRLLRDAVVDAGPRRVTLRLHPAAAPVRLVVLPDGDLEVTGDTAAIGPGYHAHVVARLAPLLDELDYAWAAPPPTLPALQAALTGWVAAELAAGATRLAIPGDRAFVVDAPVLTALGPRDAAWRDAVLASPVRAADVFAWWGDGPAESARSRALLALWHDVPWREPLDADERAIMVRADADLAAAHAADPAAALPWAAWAELRALLGEEIAAALRDRAAADAAPPVGYRRHPLRVDLTAAWRITLPGAFVGRWEDEGERYWASDGDRLVEIVAFTADPAMSSAELLGVAPERHPVLARVDAADRQGRAEAYTEATVRVVIGLMAATPEVAIVTCKGPADAAAEVEGWALDVWRSLAPVR